jgi:nucleotide-binding universal stress UspA family protein
MVRTAGPDVKRLDAGRRRVRGAVFRNVLVGVDRSASSDRALAEAVDITRESCGRIGILAVVPRLNWCMSTSPFTLPVSQAQLEADLQAEVRRHVEEADAAIPTDCPVTKLVASGNEAEALLTHVLDGPWDLVVVGRHSAFDRRTLRGRLGARLARRCPVPVLIVPADAPAARERREGVTAYAGGRATTAWPSRSTVTSRKGGWRSQSSRSRSS